MRIYVGPSNRRQPGRRRVDARQLRRDRVDVDVDHRVEQGEFEIGRRLAHQYREIVASLSVLNGGQFRLDRFCAKLHNPLFIHE